VLLLLLITACSKEKPGGAKASLPATVKTGKAAVAELNKPPPAGVERWRGTIQSRGPKVEIYIDFKPGADGKTTATLAFPKNKVFGFPLKDVVYTPEQIKFTLHNEELPAANEYYELKRTVRAGDKATGTLSMKGKKKRTVSMERIGGNTQTDNAPKPLPTASSSSG